MAPEPAGARGSPRAVAEITGPPLIGFERGRYSPRQVKSFSVKPRLAGRQPSYRGGVLRVKTWPRINRVLGKRDP